MIPVFIIWEIWNARNGARFDDRKFLLQAAIRRIDNTCQILLSFKHYPQDTYEDKAILSSFGIFTYKSKAPEFLIVKWLLPPHCKFKLNTDGASRGNPGRSGGGGGVRDSQGNLLFAFFSYFGIRTSFMAELRALVTGLRLCLALGCRPGIVEMDSKIIVELLTNRSHPPWTAHPWWREAISISDRLQVRFIHTYREGNCFADSLANHGVIMEQNRLILQENELPRAARGFLRLDRIGLPYIRIAERHC